MKSQLLLHRVKLGVRLLRFMVQPISVVLLSVWNEVLKKPPVIISMCALSFTVWQAKNSLYAEKIKSLPDLQFRSVTDTQSKAGCGNDPGTGIGPTQSLCLENSGVGSARIIGVDVFIDNKLVIKSDPGLDWLSLKDSLVASGIKARLAFQGTLPPKLTIRPSDSITLLRWNNSNPEEDLHTAFQTGKINLAVCFCNYYRDCFYMPMRARAMADLEVANSCLSNLRFTQRKSWFDAPISRSVIEEE